VVPGRFIGFNFFAIDRFSSDMGLRHSEVSGRKADCRNRSGA
jgi:hypothetical protein